MKPAARSRTILTATTTLAGAIVALILHYTDAVALGPEGLGSAWTTVVMSILMAVLRLQTTVPIGSAPTQGGGDGAEDGPAPLTRPKTRGRVKNALKRASVAFAAIVFAGLFLPACPARYTCASGAPKLTRHADGSATLVVPCDSDPEAVRVQFKTFAGLRVDGYDCKPKGAPDGTP